MRKAWKEWEDKFLRREYQHKSRTELAKELRRTVSSIENRITKLGLKKKGNPGQFKKGLTPWNKGRRYNAGGKSEKTRFKAGHRPHTTRKEGEIYLRNDHGTKYWWIKAGKPKALHRHLWEQEYGKIPRGHVVAFKDGDPMNCALDNLELRSRAEHVRMSACKCDLKERGVLAYRSRKGKSWMDIVLEARV